MESLHAQMAAACIVKRENTGLGFITTVEVPSACELVDARGSLGNATYAYVDGLKHGLGFVLLLKDGRLHVLDGYSLAGEDTSALPFFDIKFQISNTPSRT